MAILAKRMKLLEHMNDELKGMVFAALIQYHHSYCKLLHIRFFKFNSKPSLAPVTKSESPAILFSSDISIHISLLQDCADINALRQFHALLLVTGFEQNPFVATKLVKMYSEHGNLGNARQVFDKICQRNVFLWNAIIRGYAKIGFCKEILAFYRQMQEEGLKPNNFTFSFVLKACADLSALKEGRDVHDCIVNDGIEPDVFVGTGLIDMYIKCRCIEDARQVFDKMSQRNVVSWTAMIAGYSQIGYANEALMLFNQMRQLDVKPNSFTISSVLSACAEVGDLWQGKWIHDYAVSIGMDSDIFVMNSLVDMYAKCGSIEIARQLFDTMSRRDVVSWNAMIAGYAQNGHADKALELFHQMQRVNMLPNSVTITSVLQACAHLGALQQGKWIHDYAIINGLISDICVENSLVAMYSKCGCIQLARQVFDQIPEKNVISWTAMIAGYGMHGHGGDAVALFSQMQQKGVKPDNVTFVCILTACSHAGLVDEGRHYFELMSQKYCFTPRLDHYACMVDLLGRAGLLNEAQDFIERMPLKPHPGVWGALLGACRIHCNVELGEKAAECLFELDPQNAGYYVLLSNVYAAAGRWDGVAKVKTMIKDRQVKKSPGCSFVEVNSKIHAFTAGDETHPQSDKIYAMLETLSRQMDEAGYVPSTSSALHNVAEEIKESILYVHSEKLAIAFALLSTSPGTPIRITKNLRVCGDCHNAAKFISKIVSREIIMRDIIRFHHFKNGLCSCQDYW